MFRRKRRRSTRGGRKVRQEALLGRPCWGLDRFWEVPVQRPGELAASGSEGGGAGMVHLFSRLGCGLRQLGTRYLAALEPSRPTSAQRIAVRSLSVQRPVFLCEENTPHTARFARSSLSVVLPGPGCQLPPAGLRINWATWNQLPFVHLRYLLPPTNSALRPR